jgi:hypothetical protein
MPCSGLKRLKPAMRQPTARARKPASPGAVPKAILRKPRPAVESSLHHHLVNSQNRSRRAMAWKAGRSRLLRGDFRGGGSPWPVSANCTHMIGVAEAAAAGADWACAIFRGIATSIVTRASSRLPARAGDNQFAVDAIRKHRCTTHGPEARVTIKSPVKFAF